MKLLGRRRFLLILGGSAAGVGVGSKVSAMPTQTLWMLNPDWGVPLATENGSDIKSRCRGSACHAAAPHRFFLTQADAVAGRLHICCLAQPVAVSVCIDLNELMPYYRARHGGVDARCPELPSDLRGALYASQPCPRTPEEDGPSGHTPVIFDPPTPTPPTNPSPSTPAPSQPATTPAAPTPVQPVADAADPLRPGPTPSLPTTGAHMATSIAAAAVLIAAGTAATTASAARPRRDTAPTPDRPTLAPDVCEAIEPS